MALYNFLTVLVLAVVVVLAWCANCNAIGILFIDIVLIDGDDGLLARVFG